VSSTALIILIVIEGRPRFDDRVVSLQLPLPLPDLLVSTWSRLEHQKTNYRPTSRNSARSPGRSTRPPWHRIR
jgi:hypothetical protein